MRLPRRTHLGYKPAVLGKPNTEPRGLAVEEPADVLAAIAATAHDRLAPRPIGDAAEVDGWVGVIDLLADPGRLEPLIVAAEQRFRSADRSLLVAQVAREAVAALAAAAVEPWLRQRRLLDLSAPNVLLRPGAVTGIVGLRRATLTVLTDDPLAGHPDVQVVDEEEMFRRLLRAGIGRAVPAGSAPPGRPGRIAAVAAVIAAARQVIRCGDRHLWGTAALAAATTAGRVGHAVGPRADRDFARLLAARRDLARTIELVTVPEDPADVGPGPTGTGITFAVRLTCCLLYKLPEGRMCGTCCLGDRAAQLDRLADWFRRERRRLRGATA